MKFTDWMEARRRIDLVGYRGARWKTWPESDPALVAKRMKGKTPSKAKATGGKDEPAPKPPRDLASIYDVPKEKPANFDDEQWEKFQNQLKRHRDS